MKIKGIQIRKVEVKVADNMITYVKKVFRIIYKKETGNKNEFHKVAGCKANIQNSIILLYTGNKQSEFKILRIPFTNSIKNMKHLTQQNMYKA